MRKRIACCIAILWAGWIILLARADAPDDIGATATTAPATRAAVYAQTQSADRSVATVSTTAPTSIPAPVGRRLIVAAPATRPATLPAGPVASVTPPHTPAKPSSVPPLPAKIESTPPISLAAKPMPSDYSVLTHRSIFEKGRYITDSAGRARPWLPVQRLSPPPTRRLLATSSAVSTARWRTFTGGSR